LFRDWAGRIGNLDTGSGGTDTSLIISDSRRESDGRNQPTVSRGVRKSFHSENLEKNYRRDLVRGMSRIMVWNVTYDMERWPASRKN
jgi:hypothetical protein